jgi:hypothetical protein
MLQTVNVNSNVDSYVTGQAYSHFTRTLEMGLKIKVLKNVLKYSPNILSVC